MSLSGLCVVEKKEVQREIFSYKRCVEKVMEIQNIENMLQY